MKTRNEKKGILLQNSGGLFRTEDLSNERWVTRRWARRIVLNLNEGEAKLPLRKKIEERYRKVGE